MPTPIVCQAPGGQIIPWFNGCPGGTVPVTQSNPNPQANPQTQNGAPGTNPGPSTNPTTVVSNITNNLIPKGVGDWISNASNWKHLGLILAGSVLVLLGLIAFMTDTEGKTLTQVAKVVP